MLRNADELSFADIEKNILNISEKARNGKLTIEDLQGGTFTISNGGVYGSMLSTPILNPPQSGVLGMHNIVERPVVINDEIKIHKYNIVFKEIKEIEGSNYLAIQGNFSVFDKKDKIITKYNKYYC